MNKQSATPTAAGEQLVRKALAAFVDSEDYKVGSDREMSRNRSNQKWMKRF